MKIETIFANMLRERMRQSLLDLFAEGSSQNRKQQKKKLKKKQKQLLQKVEESVEQAEQAKKEREEAERQRMLYIMADKQSSPPPSSTTKHPPWTSLVGRNKPPVKQVVRRVDTDSVRQKDLEGHLKATPIPSLKDGVSVKYVYPELPEYQQPSKSHTHTA